MARAQVWTPTNVRAMNLKTGPRGAGSFPPGATVRCEFVDKKIGGASPKFLCNVGGRDEVMVKYGPQNGEVYGEVLTSRVLWALGFAADAVYPVSVICHGCPTTFGGAVDGSGDMRFELATIKRRKPGREWESDGKAGWSWEELTLRAPAAGGAPIAQRDALTLLAVFLQHTDSKAEQQRILCSDSGSGTASGCRRPWLMVGDTGLTFGSATRTNDNSAGSVNLVKWRRTSVWKEGSGCVGNLSKSFTGTLDDPVIGEGGRSFLARLLAQLSDAQLHDLFQAARVNRRLRSPEDLSSGPGTVDEWVTAFQQKRQEIANRRCA